MHVESVHIVHSMRTVKNNMSNIILCHSKHTYSVSFHSEMYEFHLNHDHPCKLVNPHAVCRRTALIMAAAVLWCV